MKWSGDYRYLDFVSTSFIYALGNTGDFTGGCTGSCSGKWNDDIGWWGLASMTAGETFGANTPISSTTLSQSGQSWLFVASYTLFQMMNQFDTSSCNGGIFWARDRESIYYNIKNYKSAISNEEAAVLGARIYMASQDQKALDAAKLTYDWTMNQLVRPEDYHIFDGLYGTPEGCQVQNTSVSMCT